MIIISIKYRLPYITTVVHSCSRVMPTVSRNLPMEILIDIFFDNGLSCVFSFCLGNRVPMAYKCVWYKSSVSWQVTGAF